MSSPKEGLATRLNPVTMLLLHKWQMPLHNVHDVAKCESGGGDPCRGISLQNAF